MGDKPPMSFMQHFMLLARFNLRLEWSRPERILTPMLLAITILLMFSFSLAELDQSLKPKLFIGESAITVLFALQIAFSRAFDLDQQDKVFELSRTYPVSFGAVFLAKYLAVTFLSILILIPTVLFAGIFNQSLSVDAFFAILGISILGLLGLTALGILLTAMTTASSTRQLLYPLIFFPLSTPVLLVTVQFSQEYLDHGFSPSAFQWLFLLCCFNLIYFSLSFGLFSELLEPE